MSNTRFIIVSYFYHEFSHFKSCTFNHDFITFLSLTRLMTIEAENAINLCESSNEMDDSVILAEGKLILKWSVSQLDQSISIRISIPTADTSSFSWVAIGFSEAGGMVGADIVTVEFNSGSTPSITDRHVPWVASPLVSNPMPFPVVDAQQDWILTCSIVSNERREAGLYRLLATLDKEDRPIVEGNMHVIYAWGDGRVGYHGSNRGSTLINLLGKSTKDMKTSIYPPQDTDNTTLLRFSPPYTTQPRISQYVCQAVDIGRNSLQHAVAVETTYINTPGAQYIHHILIHMCGDSEQAVRERRLYFQYPFPCGAQNINDEGNSPLGNGVCKSLLYTAAMNSHPFVLPDDVGVLVGGQFRYLVIEVHINNPNMAQGIEISSIARMFSTSKLRSHNAGSMTIGDPLVTFSKIKQNQLSSHYEASCTPSCTGIFVEQRHIFGSALHMHSYGRQIWTTHIKFNDKKHIQYKSIFAFREYWNVGFQSSDHVSVTLDPGDMINTHCLYDTTKTFSDVTFGQDSANKMCVAFLFYYPFDPSSTATEVCGILNKYGGGSVCGTNFISETNPVADGDVALPTISVDASGPRNYRYLFNDYLVVVAIVGSFVFSFLVCVVVVYYLPKRKCDNVVTLAQVDSIECQHLLKKV